MNALVREKRLIGVTTWMESGASVACDKTWFPDVFPGGGEVADATFTDTVTATTPNCIATPSWTCVVGDVER